MIRARRRGAAAAARPHQAFRPGRPYRGLFTPPLNAAAKLSIPVVGTSVAAMHPDVIDFGTAWHGYRYWMAMTPYNGNSDTEIPSIVATNDITNGGTWVVPTGYTNPITPDPAGVDHMADVDLVYDSTTGRLYVFYVVTNETSYQDVRSKWTTGDGTWSSETVVLAGAVDAYTNPSVIKTATGWRMYYTNDTGPLDGLYYRDTTGAPDAGYGAQQTATLSLNFGAYSRKMQNINAVKDTDGSIIIIIGDGRSDGLNGAAYFARSSDGGATFTITGPPVIDLGGSGAWDGGGIYRSSVLVDTSSTIVLNGANVHLWYSAYKTLSEWGTGYAQIPAACLRL